MYFAFEDMPPELQAAIREQQAAVDMSTSNYRHNFIQVIDNLDEDGLSAIATFIHNLGGHESVYSAFWEGTIARLAHDKFGVCLGCGLKHDEELAKMATPDGPVETVQPIPMPPVKTDNLYAEGAVTPSLKAWPDQIRDLPEDFLAKCDEYKLNLVAGEYPKVECANCGMQYPSLEDRMIKPPDECSGCHQKAKFG